MSLLNEIGNDFFSNVEDLYELNKEFAKRTEIIGFKKTISKNMEGEVVFNYCIIDPLILNKKTTEIKEFKVSDVLKNGFSFTEKIKKFKP